MLVLGIVALAPWAEGAARPLAFGSFGLVAAALVAALARWPSRLAARPAPGERLLAVGVAGFVALAALQLAPLGSAALGGLAPGVVELCAPYPPPLRHLTLDAYATRCALHNVLVAAAVALAVARALPRRRLPWVFAALVLSGAANASFGAAATLARGVPVFRAHGSYVNPNHYAGYLALCLPLACALAGVGARRGSARGRQLWLTCLGLAAIGIMQSGSRGGALAGLAGVVAYGVVVGAQGRKQRGPLAVVGLLLLVVLGVAGLGPLLGRIGELGTVRNRLQVWEVALRIFARSPCSGWGSTRTVR